MTINKEIENAKTRHIELLNELSAQLNLYQQRSQEETTATQGRQNFFDASQNFFMRSVTIFACAYLESYLKSIWSIIYLAYNKRLKMANIPYHLIEYEITRQKPKEEDTDGEEKEETLPKGKGNIFQLNFEEQFIEKHVSPNIEKTISAFKILGIDITKNKKLNKELKDFIVSKIKSRNDIVHSISASSNITFQDGLDTLEYFINYINILDEVAQSSFTAKQTNETDE